MNLTSTLDTFSCLFGKVNESTYLLFARFTAKIKKEGEPSIIFIFMRLNCEQFKSANLRKRPVFSGLLPCLNNLNSH